MPSTPSGHSGGESGYWLDDFRPIEDTKAVTVPTLVVQVHDDFTMPPSYVQEIYDVAIARHGVITDDESVGVGRNEPALQRYSIERGEEHVLVIQAVLIRPPQDRRAGRVRHQFGEAIDELVGGWRLDAGRRRRRGRFSR
jgi:hypothetical protein